MDRIGQLVERATVGDMDAFGELVRATQTMAFAVATRVLRDPAAAEDAVQQSYLRAFKRLGDLRDPDAFQGWFRRMVLTVALNELRKHRTAFLRLDDAPDIPVLDDEEQSWSAVQRRRLAGALLTLTDDDRRICDRRYHGAWTTRRLAAAERLDDAAMRKRLQRIRDKLRREIDVLEQRELVPGVIPLDLPERVVELLAKPRLTDLPENPVGQIQELIRAAFHDFTEAILPEVVDLSAAGPIASDAMYVDPSELHRIDAQRVLRYDLTLPLLISTRYSGHAIRLWTAGKTYRVCDENTTHLEAFHQAEAFRLDLRSELNAADMTARVLDAMDTILPGRILKVVPTRYPMCTRAWELEVEDNGAWFEVLAWGVFTDRVVSYLGADPTRHTAVGVGFGLERLAMLRYGIDDIRKVEMMRVG